MVAKTERREEQPETVVLPENLTNRELFTSQAAAIISHEKLLDDSEAEKLLANEELVNRMMLVTQYAHAILKQPGEKFARLEKTFSALHAFRDWERAVFDFYALTAPAIDIDDIPAILCAEKHLKHKRISKDGAVQKITSLSRGETLWTSQMSRPRIVKSQLSDEYLKFLATEGATDAEKEQSQKLREQLIDLREDIERWFGPAGLLLHTAVASWSIQTTVENLQKYIGHQIPENSRNKWHRYLLAMSSTRARIWLNLHDLGRLVTHDPYDHAVLTHVISQMAGLPRELYNDYDLPNILELGNETPLVPEFTPPKRPDEEPREAYNQRVNKLRVDHVDDILEKLEGMSQADTRYDNPVSVLLFWLIDAYTKLYDIRGRRTLSSRTDHIDPREIAEHFYHYANIQPGDEAALFLGRFRYRLLQSGSSLDDLSEADKKIYRYYSRQYELAQSIFVWIQERLGIPSQLLWNLIFAFTERNDKHIDPNGDFSHHPADPHSDIWKSAVDPKRHETLDDRRVRLSLQPQPSSQGLLKKIRELPVADILARVKARRKQDRQG